MALLTISGFILVVYLPIAAIVTLGILALWNKWRPPKLWHVVVATSCAVLLPWLADGFSLQRGILHALGNGLMVYIPVLIPAVLWALQRRNDDGEFTTLARRSGSLLVGYIIFVVLILPLAAIGLAVLSNLQG